MQSAVYARPVTVEPSDTRPVLYSNGSMHIIQPSTELDETSLESLSERAPNTRGVECNYILRES